MGTGMFLHSPLLYWNCSLSAIKADANLITTVNKEFNKRSPANVTLRWGSVFAGKKFHHNQLTKADALVISLFYRLDSSAGELWDRRAAILAQEADTHGRYDVYPSDGKEKGSTLYEFRFQPMSKLDNFMLAGCYLLTLAYLTISLRNLRAIKSRLGLIAAVLIQMAFSVSSSFTILAFFKVPVSHVPREVFPFVVIVIGSENMFRLINAVLETPAEQPTTSRIAIALGEVGFLSSVAVGTDLVLLVILGQFSVPAVREFCTFAGVALVMDFLLHLTYFLAVLSVDVRRLELRDSLDRLTFNKPESYRGRMDSEVRGKSGELIMQRAMPMSTRIAGSVILICFLVALNMHFLENQSPLRTVISLCEMATNRGGTRLTDSPGPNPSPIMPINVARTPTAWLKRQDQLTGKELIGVVKPGAYRMVAKAYDPIFFVLRGSSRSKIPGLMPSLISAVAIDTVKEYMQGFILTVIVVAAAVTLLMNHLLMKDITADMVEAPENEGPLLTCQTLYEGHSLDVVMLAASPRGVVVSVGLDRRIVVWKLKTMWQLPSKDIIRPTCPQHSLWPIIAIALDEKGEWLAIAPRQGNVSIWSIKEATFKTSVSIELGGHQPSAFFFEPRGDGPRLIVLRHDGWLSEVCVRTGNSVHHRICTGVVVSCSHGGFTPRLPLRVVTACQRGRIFVTSKSAGEWNSRQLSPLEQPAIPSMLDPSENCTILPLSSLGMIVTSKSCKVDLVDLLSGSVIRTFQTGQFKPKSLRVFHANRRTCLYCGCPAVLSFSIAYSERESGMFIMHTWFSSSGRMRDICLRAERDRRERKCSGFESAVESTHWLENVETWEPTNLNLVAGIRRRETIQEEPSSDDSELLSPHQASSLRRRKKMGKKHSTEDDDEWEAWTMHADGVVTSYPLSDCAAEESDESLLVSRAGPVCRVGQRSVAVGFGNTVKLLAVGNERYEGEDDDDISQISRKARSHYHRR
ncbi:sterol-sensing domain of SREBP cleavage-activation-domain-containing protein [Tuber brumale]|nr:sterol-sensing domain of SREBP cleavage-activation-domain-containing protein [Tuber brumale]